MSDREVHESITADAIDSCVSTKCVFFHLGLSDFAMRLDSLQFASLSITMRRILVSVGFQQLLLNCTHN